MWYVQLWWWSLALKNQLFDNAGKFQGQYFSNQKYEIVEKNYFNLYSNFMYSIQTGWKMLFIQAQISFIRIWNLMKNFLDFWQKWTKLKMAEIWEQDYQFSSKFVICHIS